MDLIVCAWCNGLLVPVLVPPALEKSVGLRQVKDLWIKAANELRAADRVVFVGCSLRPADFDLLALLKATIGRRRAVKIEVVSRSNISAPRYSDIFPKHRISFFPGGVEKWIEGR